jgi:hypothetical protein
MLTLAPTSSTSYEGMGGVVEQNEGGTRLLACTTKRITINNVCFLARFVPIIFLALYEFSYFEV